MEWDGRDGCDDALLEPFTREYEKEFSVKFNVLHAKKGLAQRLK